MTDHANGAEPEPGPQLEVVQPVPHPKTYQFIQGEFNGQKVIVVIISHAAGQFVDFLDATSGHALAAQLDDAATQAGSALILPPSARRFM